MDDNTRDIAKRAVVAVDGGRGFIIEVLPHNLLAGRLIVTAAHCLPDPPPPAIADTEERTYKELVGRLADPETHVSAECMFADPVADIAVLATPDNQELWNEAEACKKLMEEAEALPIADAPAEGPGWLLTLENQWVDCVVRHFGGPLYIFDAAEPIVDGMSGSPILNSDGAAMGIVCCSSGSGEMDKPTGGGPNPRLTDDLPGGLLRGIADDRP